MTQEDQQRYPPISAMLKSGASVTIRPLSTDDTDSLAAFYESIPREDYRFYCPHPLDREHAVTNAAKALAPDEVVLVAETANSEIAGYAWYRWQEGKESSGFGICIRRDHQNSGAGGALMTRLFEIARTIGPPTMHLTVQRANDRGVALYRKMGFQVVREQMRAQGMANNTPSEPEYYMERRANS